MDTMELMNTVRSIPDFPKPGIIFRDVTTLFKDPDAYRELMDRIAASFDGIKVDAVAGPEARGFVLGSVLAYQLHAGFIPVRKPGKLPYESVSYSYDLEYGSDPVEIHKDAITPGMKVVLLDDLIATGGTIKAAAELVEELGGEVVKILFLLELKGLNGRALLEGYDVETVVAYDGK